ncbi:MAG TPA: ATP-binding protein [Chitinophagaceae bacterium]|nr:ATP-binding protein [Chitinophagaceae bacterium]
MKVRVGYLFWIFMLAFGLMILVAAAQMLTTRNINGLKKGNREAAITFSVNNRLQDLINLSFELETKLIAGTFQKNQEQSIQDSLTMLGYNASLLQDINLSEQGTAGFKRLNEFINKQIEISLDVLNKKQTEGVPAAASLKKLHIADSIYTIALSIQRYLEKDLENTLANNTKVSGKLSAYNKVLAIIAIGAVLILATIIINRHMRQVQLIAKLEEATAAATKSAKIKDQFLANMSHEIRTPLNAIIGFTKLLSQTPLNAEQQQYSVIIKDAGKNLMNIVNDILDISKIEAGKMRIESKKFDLTHVMQTLEYMFESAAAEKELSFFQQVEKNVPVLLKGDPERLAQILINLISNAIKFTKKGYVNVGVSLYNEEKEKSWIRFSVKDSGVGVPADMHEKIFQRFEQLNPDEGQVTKGTGLGLSIVKSLVDQMGGEISLSSESGKGSEFTVILPFEKVTIPISEENTNEQLNTHFYYPGACILVVEDNRINQLYLKHTLATFDIEVDIATNGREAIEAVTNNKYDLILLDIQMPVMDGYAAISAMRQTASFSTPVIAMTAYTMPGEREKCLKAGMNDYIAKPVEFGRLVAVFENYLQNKRSSKKVNKNPILHSTFLLDLSGGDEEMVNRILAEIKLEIPGAVKRLENLIRNPVADNINTDCHHMISTFSPLGGDTQVMRKIRQLHIESRELNNENHFTGIINDIIYELYELEKDIQEAIEQG